MRARPAGLQSGSGPAKVDRRTKDLLRRLQPGDVAVIDHENIDRIAAEGLVEARPAAVVNVAASISGRYPNAGPLLIAAAGIPLVDGVGPEVMDAVHEGEHVRLEGSEVWSDGVLVAKGVRQDLASLEAEYDEAKAHLGQELELFAANTVEYMQREHRLLLDPLEPPELATKLRGRHVLIVVRGYDYKDDLAQLRSYIREMKPVLIGVDGGADALVQAGHRPDLIIGDFDSVTEPTLRGGAELVVHAYADGRAPGAARLEQLGLRYEVFGAPGTSEDVAMLLAHEEGADLIVAVGTHASMVEFLDKGRPGMASTFLTRLRVAEILVDAKGVSKLYQSRLRKRDFTFFLVAALLTIVAIVLVAYPLQVFLRAALLILREGL